MTDHRVTDVLSGLRPSFEVTSDRVKVNDGLILPNGRRLIVIETTEHRNRWNVRLRVDGGSRTFSAWLYITRPTT